MTNRERTLRAGSWVLAAGVLAGVSALGYRAFLREKERTSEEEQEARAEAARSAEVPKPATTPAAAAVARCKDAVAKSFVVGNWKQTGTICQEAEQDARGDDQMKALLLALRCHEWQVKAGMEQGDEDESDRPRDVRLVTELQRWIRQDCLPEASLRKLVEPLSVEAACALRLEPLVSQNDGHYLSRLEGLRRLPEECQDSADARALFVKLERAAEQEASQRCTDLDDADVSETESLMQACRTYVGLKYCPSLPQLLPPPGKKLQLNGKLKAKGWRPEDPVLVSMLRKIPEQQLGGFACTKDGRLVQLLDLRHPPRIEPIVPKQR